MALIPLGLAFVASILAFPVEAAAEIMQLTTRPGVTVKILIMTPDSSSKGTLLLFPEGNGANHFSERGGKVRLGNDFLVRASDLFVERGFGVAIVDVPSDQAYGMSDQFRTSKEREVVTAITDWIQGKPVVEKIGP